MAFRQTFLITALPDGIDGTKVRLAVLVSPRLMGDSDSLNNWPDARDWPDILPTSWEVIITPQGGSAVTVPAEKVSEVVPQGGYDLSAWQALFPPTMAITPYEPTDRSDAPIFSYPAAKVADAVRDLHTAVLESSRNDFPATQALLANPAFAALLEAANPAVAEAVCEKQLDGPLSDSEVTLAQAFAMTDCFHGVRPGSLPPPGPAVSAVSPLVGDEVGGQTLTVTGVRLSGATKVTFFNAEFGTKSVATGIDVNADGTVLTCTTPEYNIRSLWPDPSDPTVPEKVTVDVLVTTPLGTSQPSAGSKFTYLNNRPDPPK